MAELTGETIIVDDRSANRIKLRDQITQLPIENPLSLNKFLNPEDETIVNKDEDIFVSVVNHYASARPGEEEESSDEEEVKEVDITEAVRVYYITLSKLTVVCGFLPASYSCRVNVVYSLRY